MATPLSEAQTQTVAAWKRYGVEIEQDTFGHWSWAEVDEAGENCGPYSPPFSGFEACVNDLVLAFGPMDERVV